MLIYFQYLSQRRWGEAVRRSVCCWFCIVAVCLGGKLAWAEDPRWEASAGFDNTFKEGAWTPVFVDITNEGSAQAGQIVVPVTYPGSDKLKLKYAASVDLPTHSRKRYTLYVPSDGLEDIYLNLARRREKHKLAAQRVAAPEDTLVVVIGGDPGLLNFLIGTKAAAGQARSPAVGIRRQGDPGEIQVGHAQWDGLPESWLGWEGVDAVVLGDAGFATASPQAVEALLQWIELGGMLVVPGGALAPAIAASPVELLLPMQVAGTTTLPDLDGLGNWADQPIEKQPVLAAAGTLHQDATILCGTRQQPLIAVRTVGSGRVAMTTFDFHAAPVKYWDGQTSMWPRLLAQARAPASLTRGVEESSDPYYSSSALADAATYTPAARLPSMWLIVGFLIVYIIALAPVQYLVLKRLDRRELAWVTTPLLVAVFTVGAYGVGYGIRGGHIIVNRLGIIEAEPGSSLARGRGYIGLFSPARAAYDILLEKSAVGAREFASAQRHVGGKATVVYGPQPKIADVDMHMWTTRAFGVEFLVDLHGGISGFIEYDGKDLRATVKNETGLALRKCRIVSGTSEGTQHDLADGQQAELVLTPGAPARTIGSWGGYGPPPAPPHAGREIEDLALAALFGADKYYGYPGPRATDERSGPFFVAVSQEPLVPVKLAKTTAKVNDRNLLIVRLPVRLPSGQRVLVPGWLIPRRLVAQQGNVHRGRSPHYDGGVTVDEGEAVFEFRVPVGEAGGKAAALQLTILVAAPGTAPPGRPGSSTLAKMQVCAYDFPSEKWQTLKNVQQHPSLPHPEQLMSREGRVLVKLEVSQGTANFSLPTLVAEVESF